MISWFIPLSGQCPRKKNKDSRWFPPDFQKKTTHELVTKATCSMYGIFTYIWLKVMVNVGKYTIHRVYGYSHLSTGFASSGSSLWQLASMWHLLLGMTETLVV